MHDPFVGGAWRGSTDESRQSQRQDQEQRTGVSAPQGLGQQITWRGWSAGLGTPENGNLVHTGGDASEIKRGNPPCHLPKNHKAGLVGRLFYCGTGSCGLGSIVDPECRNPEILVPNSLCAAGSPARAAGNGYITIARFSSSCIRTGIAHPAISTRPAASNAALGDTP